MKMNLDGTVANIQSTANFLVRQTSGHQAHDLVLAVTSHLPQLIAYMIVKTRHAGRWLLDFLSWLPWSIPGILLGVALLWTFLQTRIFLPIYGTIYLLMIAMVIKSMPFGTQMIKSVLIQLGSDLEEA